MNALGPEEILAILPHRYPFLLVDRIQEIVCNEYAIGLKNVTLNEPFFQGHFPHYRVMPGVLVIEAMAQVGGVLVYYSDTVTLGKTPLFTGIDRGKFRRRGPGKRHRELDPWSFLASGPRRNTFDDGADEPRRRGPRVPGLGCHRPAHTNRGGPGGRPSSHCR